MQDEPAESSKEVAKGSMWGLLGSAFFYSFSFFYTIIVARLVPQDELGLFFLAMGIVSLPSVIDNLGMASALVRYVPFFEGRNEKGKIRELLRVSVILTIASAAVLVLLLWWQADNIGALYQNPRLPDMVRMLSLSLLLTNIFAVTTSFIRARADIRSMQLSQNLQNLLKLVLAPLLIMTFGPSANAVGAALLLSFVPAILLSLVFVRKRAEGLPAGSGISAAQLTGEIIPFGLMFGFLSSLGALFFSTSRVLLGFLLDPSEATEAVAVYAVAASLAGVLLTIPNSIGGIFLPMISRLYGKNDTLQIGAATETAQRWSLLMTVPFGLVMMAFSGDILAALYGEQYRAGGIVMSILALGILLKAVSYVLSLTLSAMRLVRLQIEITVAAGLLNIVLNILLIPVLGIAGSAISSLMGFAANATLLAYYARKHFGYRLPAEVFKLALAGLATLAIMFLSGPIISSLSAGIQGAAGPDAPFYVPKILYAAFIGLMSAAAIAFFACFCLLLKCIGREDVAMLAKVLKKARVPNPAAEALCRMASYGVGRESR
ncbi:MAG: oligosaccharide flippase family protein [Candidatus Micrarchaeota archaeon]